MKTRLFIFFQYIVPQHLLSRFFGAFANSQNVTFKNRLINWFTRKYQVDMNEAIFPDADNYFSFNDFFTRALKPGARIVDQAANAIVSPADGVFSACGDIEAGKLFQAKGHYFSLADLLGGDEQRASKFEEGNFATIYLSPKDYHRVHMPFSGKLVEMVYIPGKLFSVNQATSENIPSLFARNERVVCIFDTAIGPMALILVGAMIVASIETVWAGQVAPSKQKMYSSDYSEQHPEIQIGKGEEAGRFKLGSTAIVLFGPGVMQWDTNCIDGASVRMGQKIAALKDEQGPE